MMSKAKYHNSLRLWVRVVLIVHLFLVANFSAMASYKVVLRDGKIIEAKSKPISLEGSFHFTSSLDNKFYTLPIGSIDLSGTEAANRLSQNGKQAKRHFTNEDLSVKDKDPASGSGALPISKQAKSASKKSIRETHSTAGGENRNEAYWRGQAREIKDQIALVDSEIRDINSKIQSRKSDGIQIGFGTYNQYVLVDFENRIKTLENEKEKLQKQLMALEEEARKAGALPGWLR